MTLQALLMFIFSLPFVPNVHQPLFWNENTQRTSVSDTSNKQARKRHLAFNERPQTGCVHGICLTHCGRVTQICVFNTVKLGTSASSP
jgi:hypothetical protein